MKRIFLLLNLFFCFFSGLILEGSEKTSENLTEELFQSDPLITNYFERLKESVSRFAYRIGSELKEETATQALICAYEQNLLPETEGNLHRQYSHSFSSAEMEALIEHLNSLEGGKELSIAALEGALVNTLEEVYSSLEWSEAIRKVLDGDQSALSPEIHDFYALIEEDRELVTNTPLKHFIESYLAALVEKKPEFMPFIMLSMGKISPPEIQEAKVAIKKIGENIYRNPSVVEKLTARYYRENYSLEDVEKIRDFYSGIQGSEIGPKLGQIYRGIVMLSTKEEALRSWIHEANTLLKDAQIQPSIFSVISCIYPGSIIVKPGISQEDIFIF